MWEPVALTQQRATKTSDGAGGKTTTWATVETLTATMHYYSAQRLARLEQSGQGGAASGPGAQTHERKFARFEKPFPTIRTTGDGLTPAVPENDRLLDPDGKVWKVLFVRLYTYSYQVDLERVA